jgi:hypothetical protein
MCGFRLRVSLGRPCSHSTLSLENHSLTNTVKFPRSGSGARQVNLIRKAGHECSRRRRAYPILVAERLSFLRHHVSDMRGCSLLLSCLCNPRIAKDAAEAISLDVDVLTGKTFCLCVLEWIPANSLQDYALSRFRTKNRGLMLARRTLHGERTFDLSAEAFQRSLL